MNVLVKDINFMFSNRFSQREYCKMNGEVILELNFNRENFDKVLQTLENIRQILQEMKKEEEFKDEAADVLIWLKITNAQIRNRDFFEILSETVKEEIKIGDH